MGSPRSACASLGHILHFHDPGGLESGAPFPFHLVGRAYIMDNIMEWLSPDFHKDRVFEFLLLTYASTVLLARKKVDLVEGVLLLFLAHMSLYSARYIPLFLLVATPILAPRLTGIIEEAGGRLPEKGLFGRLYRRVSTKSAKAAPFEERFRTHVWVYVALAASLLIAATGGSVRVTRLDFGIT